MNVHVSKCVPIHFCKVGFNQRLSIWMHMYADRVTCLETISTRNSVCKYKFLIHIIVDLRQLATYTDVKVLA